MLAPDGESATSGELTVRRAETGRCIKRMVLAVNQKVRPVVHVEQDGVPRSNGFIGHTLQDEPDISGVQADPWIGSSRRECRSDTLVCPVDQTLLDFHYIDHGDGLG